MDPTPRIERGQWRFCRPPPSHLARSGRLCWHQGKDLNPHLVVQSHGSYPLDDPGAKEWRLRRESNPPLSARQAAARPACIEGATKMPWWWCAGEDLRLHSTMATGLQAAGFTSCPSRRVNTTTAVVWLAMPIRFSRCGARNLRAKEKGPGVARPFVEILLLAREVTPGPVTLNWVPVERLRRGIPVPLRAGSDSRHHGCAFKSRRHTYAFHGNRRIIQDRTMCQGGNLTHG